MTQVKICGITRLEDALAAVEAGADMLGFNFHPPSPRYISPEKCAEITTRISKSYREVVLVGVFVNLPAETVLRIVNTCQLHLVQLHGDEPPAALESFNGRAFKALRGVPEDSSIISGYTQYRLVDAPSLLLDAATPGLYGGSGQTGDWTAASSLAATFPLLLAGGLTAENVAAAIRQVKPWGVDVASGVERSPGIKDPAKILAFVRAARGAQPDNQRRNQ